MTQHDSDGYIIAGTGRLEQGYRRAQSRAEARRILRHASAHIAESVGLLVRPSAETDAIDILRAAETVLVQS